jgi:hypothetical protein
MSESDSGPRFLNVHILCPTILKAFVSCLVRSVFDSFPDGLFVSGVHDVLLLLYRDGLSTRFWGHLLLTACRGIKEESCVVKDGDHVEEGD